MRSFLKFAVFVLWALPLPAMADVGPTCDANFWDVLRVKSEMEGRRELEIGQSLLLKSDSVLEYSCFRTNLGRVAGNPVFHSDLPAALNGLVGDSAASYLNSNFGHTLGGGSDAPDGGTCETMKAVWQFLKCRNISMNNFINFASLPGTDLRTLPEACGNPAVRAAEWQAGVAAYNPAPGGLGAVEAGLTFANLLRPSACSAITPIPTGVIASSRDGERPDAVCAAPGCSYNAASNSCE